MKTAICIKPFGWDSYSNRQRITLMEIVQLLTRMDRFPNHTGVKNRNGHVIYLGQHTFEEHFRVLE